MRWTPSKQLRGALLFAAAIVKLFTLDLCDDAEQVDLRSQLNAKVASIW